MGRYMEGRANEAKDERFLLAGRDWGGMLGYRSFEQQSTA